MEKGVVRAKSWVCCQAEGLVLTSMSRLLHIDHHDARQKCKLEGNSACILRISRLSAAGQRVLYTVCGGAMIPLFNIKLGRWHCIIGDELHFCYFRPRCERRPC